MIIGRNEGERFVECLESLPDTLKPVVYVDSGSTDDSVETARAFGAHVIELDKSISFTAARARNAGLASLPPETEFVQLVDGDCALADGWIDHAEETLRLDKTLAVVCGRRRERFPNSSVYNQLCDWEWDTPVGEAKACGGDAMMRLTALREVGGFRNDLIAGEEPELCVRLRAAGWNIRRIDAEMTSHDAAMTRFGQWWARSQRAGHAFAEGAALHGVPPERHWVRETRRAMFWGLLLPVAILFAALWEPWFAIFLALVYPLQVMRLGRVWPLKRAFYTVLGKVPEAMGALSYYIARVRGQKRRIVEYK